MEIRKGWHTSPPGSQAQDAVEPIVNKIFAICISGNILDYIRLGSRQIF